MAGTGAIALAAAVAVAGLAPATSSASSHREAPLIAGDPRADNTDVYAFTSPDRPDTVTFVANWIPFEEPDGGPNFYQFADGDQARYNIKVDQDGDGRADLTYTWSFRTEIRDAADTFLYNNGPVTTLDDPDLNIRQFYDLTVTGKSGRSRTLLRDAPVAPSRVGDASMPRYGKLRQEAVVKARGGARSFAGQAEDPFFADLRVFDLLYGGDLSKRGKDTFAGYNVNTIALQVPKKTLALGGDPKDNPVIGVWSTTDRRGANVTGEGSADSGWRQVSRLGNPLVNEVVVPLKFKDAFNTLEPFQDRTVQPVVDKVLDPTLPKLIEQVYGIPAPPTPRRDLFEIYLTGLCQECGPIKADLNSHRLNSDARPAGIVPAEELRLNMAVPPAKHPDRLGVLGGDLAGFPNGRRLADDVIDISLQAVEGAAQTGELVPELAEGDQVDINDVRFGKRFPYVALPYHGSTSDGRALRGADQATSTADTTPRGMRQALPTGLAATGVALFGMGGLVLWRDRRRTKSDPSQPTGSRTSTS
nr:DUF4331 domain-containing protein [Streptomyces chumphonensis]